MLVLFITITVSLCIFAYTLYIGKRQIFCKKSVRVIGRVVLDVPVPVCYFRLYQRLISSKLLSVWIAYFAMQDCGDFFLFFLFFFF